MTKKIFRSIFAVAALVLVVCLAMVIGVLYGYFNSMQEDQLREESAIVSEGVQREGLDFLSEIDNQKTRITWIAADGKVLFDSHGDATKMENHANREEVKEAIQVGVGKSERFSKTYTEKTIYFAKRVEDGSVVRLSVSQETILSLLYGMIQIILIVLLVALIISAVMANRISKRIVGPLNTLDLENPLENDVYDEVSPLLLMIEKQHRQIDAQINEMNRKQNEFLAITGNMREGLVLLNSDLKILSMNNSAARFFDTDDVKCIGHDFITVERQKGIEQAINDAVENGRSELQISRKGREYQLNASRIEDENDVAGAVLLIFDITDKNFAERNRREFTANVSHELKTPLQSIMGSAELIENGIVDKKDMPKFIGNIRSEASRLVTLIDDIIRLSRLDEKDNMPFEDIDLYKIAEDEMENLKAVAEENKVSLKLYGESAVISGVPQLVREIIHNLCENAIKYNKVGGVAEVTTGYNDDGAFISVKDNGIGIAPEHQERIFERFYRVDKSHSKDTGGTGLGLSIVKHATECMDGNISLESHEGVGTTITVNFRKK